MPGIVLLGAQFGDEGKGKITDLLADDMHVVARYQGGNNAGHTIIFEETTLKLHLIPSGILYPHIISIIGNGVVINPEVIIREMRNLEALGDIHRQPAHQLQRPPHPPLPRGAGRPHRGLARRGRPGHHAARHRPHLR